MSRQQADFFFVIGSLSVCPIFFPASQTVLSLFANDARFKIWWPYESKIKRIPGAALVNYQSAEFCSNPRLGQTSPYYDVGFKCALLRSGLITASREETRCDARSMRPICCQLHPVLLSVLAIRPWETMRAASKGTEQTSTEMKQLIRINDVTVPFVFCTFHDVIMQADNYKDLFPTSFGIES